MEIRSVGSHVARTAVGLAASITATTEDLVQIARLGGRLLDPIMAIRLVRSVLEVTSPDRPLGQLISGEGEFAEAMLPGGAIDRLFASDGPLSRLLRDEGVLEQVTARGGTLDQIESLGATAASIQPLLDELGPSIQLIADSAALFRGATSPLGDLARLRPSARRRPRPERPGDLGSALPG